MRNEQALRDYFDACLTFLKQNPNARFYQPAFPAGSPVIPPGSEQRSAVDHVVIVRKLSELHELVTKRREVIHLLESAHVELARQIMAAIAARLQEGREQSSIARKVKGILPKKKEEVNEADLDLLVERLGPYLKVDSPEAKIWQDRHPGVTMQPDRSIWEALADLPTELLDPYQPIVKLKFFRGQVAPSIDYHLTKLNLLTVSRHLPV